MINPEQDLWRSVALAALQDELRSISISVNGGRSIDKSVERSMAYFRSDDWRMICEMASITVPEDKLKKVLRTGYKYRTMHGLYADFGMMSVGGRIDGKVGHW